MSKPFCKAPWQSIELSPFGTFGVCCIMPSGLGSISAGDTFESAWSGEGMAKMRRRLLDGDLPSGCRECASKERQGVGSLREVFERVKPVVPVTNFLRTPGVEHIHHVDISLSNKCNMRCRFCNPGNSTLWMAEQRQLMAKDPDFYRGIFDIHDEIVDTDPAMLLSFLDRLEFLRRLEIKGGEPFLSKAFAPLIRGLVESGVSRGLTLDITTNGSKWSDELDELANEFGSVNLTFSVDGLGDVYKYVRGGHFSFEEHVLPNLERFLKNEAIHLNIHFTNCAYNLLGLGPFLEWYVAHFTSHRRRPTFSLGIVQNNRFLSPGVLSDQLLDEARRRLSHFDFTDVVSLVANLSALPGETRKYAQAEFWRYTTDLDESRRVSLAAMVPELAEFYETCGQIKNSLHKGLGVEHRA